MFGLPTFNFTQSVLDTEHCAVNLGRFISVCEFYRQQFFSLAVAGQK